MIGLFCYQTRSSSHPPEATWPDLHTWVGSYNYWSTMTPLPPQTSPVQGTVFAILRLGGEGEMCCFFTNTLNKTTLGEERRRGLRQCCVSLSALFTQYLCCPHNLYCWSKWNRQQTKYLFGFDLTMSTFVFPINQFTFGAQLHCYMRIRGWNNGDWSRCPWSNIDRDTIFTDRPRERSKETGNNPQSMRTLHIGSLPERVPHKSSGKVTLQCDWLA